MKANKNYEFDHLNNFARLMANENLYLRTDETMDTAYIDMEKRVISLPKFKKSTPMQVRNLMVGHECSHAIHTPAKEYIAEIKKMNNKLYSAVQNVVEDVRIDRAILRRYPGLTYDYQVGLKWMTDEKNDFFAWHKSKASGEEYGFFNQINAYFKTKMIGNPYGISFTNPEEIKLQEMIDNVTDFKSVVAASHALYEYLKDKDPYSKMAAMPEKSDETDASAISGVVIDMDSLDPATRKALEKALKGIKLGKADKEKLMEMQQVNSKNGQGNKPIYIKQRSTTYNQHHHAYNGKDIIIKRVDTDRFKRRTNISHNNNAVPTSQNERFADSKTIAGKLAAEFERKKAAVSHFYYKESKSGEIDMANIHQYKYNDNLFLRRGEIFNHKDHAFLILLDMSSSMSSYGDKTKQWLAALTMFYKKLGVPFEVWGFEDGGSNIAVTNTTGGLSHRGVSLKLIASNTDLVPNMLQKIRNIQFHSGTPLNEALYLLRSYAVEYFGAQNRDCNNIVVISDGDSNNQMGLTYDGTGTIIDEPTRLYLNNVPNMTLGMYELFRRVIRNCKVVPIFITDCREGFKINDNDASGKKGYYLIDHKLDISSQAFKVFVRTFIDEMSGFDLYKQSVNNTVNR